MSGEQRAKGWAARFGRRGGGLIAAALLLGAGNAPLFAATGRNCSLPSPTDALPTTPRPVSATQAATAALAGIVPLDQNGGYSGTNKTITIAFLGNSNSLVYAAGTVDALNGGGRLRPDLRLLEAGVNMAGITEWASLAAGSALDHAKRTALNYRLGMPQVVVLWTTKIRPDVNGTATRADVTAVLTSIKATWPAVKVVYLAEMHGAAYLEPALIQPLTRHWAIAREANLFHTMEADQIGVPPGVVLLHLPMVTNGAVPNPLVGGFSWLCNMHKVDGVHPTSADFWGLMPGEIDSQPLVGANIAERFSVDPVLQTVLFGTTPPPTRYISLPDTKLELPACVLRATLNGQPYSAPAPPLWCAAY
jgi:hypothetical protein